MKTETLANGIKEIRKKHGVSQMQFAKMIGISNRAVSKWENGISAPSTENLLKISAVFSVPLERLIEPEIGYKTEQTKKGMESLRELYTIGRGPSSSHTIGPEKACKFFKDKFKDADFFSVTLFGSLAKTGKGHGTNRVIEKTLSPVKCKIDFNFEAEDLPHPNTMNIEAYKENRKLGGGRVISVGGGKIEIEGTVSKQPEQIYKLSTLKDILDFCKKRRIRLWQYVELTEGKGIWDYLLKVWLTMKDSIERGINDEGVLPGGLNVQKRAKYLFCSEHVDESSVTRENRLISAYAFAVGEQNACGEIIATAPTCGAAGVMPAVLYYEQEKCGFTDMQILHAIATGGIIGNLIKTNASISGAQCGCQAEIGTACAMTAAALGELFNLNAEKIEYAAEVAIEHHLGLTCDPICGLVQIPCIERNAVAAMRAVNAVNIASFLSGTRKITFDNVVCVMRETGLDIKNRYKETAEGGLAKIVL